MEDAVDSSWGATWSMQQLGAPHSDGRAGGDAVGASRLRSPNPEGSNWGDPPTVTAGWVPHHPPPPKPPEGKGLAHQSRARARYFSKLHRKLAQIFSAFFG